MADDLAEEDDADEEQEEWVATGESCAVCDALDGMTFASAPKAVHPSCQCEVHPAPKNGQPLSIDCKNSWHMSDQWRPEWSGGSPGHVSNHLVIQVDVEGRCWDGSTITDTIDVDFGDVDFDHPSEWDDLQDQLSDLLWDAVSDHGEELMAQNCPDCRPVEPPVEPPVA